MANKDKIYDEIAHLVTSQHITYKKGKWINTGKYDGGVNASSSKYWPDNDANKLIAQANKRKITPKEVSKKLKDEWPTHSIHKWNYNENKKPMKDSEKKLKQIILETIQELSTTADIEGYNSAFAFSDNTGRQKKQLTKQGYTVVDKDDDKNKRKKSPGERRQVQRRKMAELNEASYKDFKTDNSVSTKKKMNQAIKKINGDLYKLERLVTHISKLKTETEYDSSKYWQVTKKSMIKAQDRLNRLLIKLKKIS